MAPLSQPRFSLPSLAPRPLVRSLQPAGDELHQYRTQFRTRKDVNSQQG